MSTTPGTSVDRPSSCTPAADDAATKDRVLVCVGPGPEGLRLVRAAHRLAARFSAEWIAVNAETGLQRSAVDARARIAEALRLAEQLGAEVHQLVGTNPAEETLRYARERRVRNIMVGKARRGPFSRLVSPSFTDRIVRHSGDIAVHLCGEDSHSGTTARARSDGALDWRGVALSAVAVTLCTVVAFTFFGRPHLQEVAMVYLLGTVLAATRGGPWVPVLTTALSVLSYDFFFTRPYYSFTVDDPRMILTFIVMFVVGIIMSGLTKRIRDQAAGASRRETRTTRLYAMSKDSAKASDLPMLLRSAVAHLDDAFAADVSILLQSESGTLEPAVSGRGTFQLDERERALATQVFENAHERAGLGTEMSASSAATFLLLRVERGKLGVLIVKPKDERRFADMDQLHLVEAFAVQISLSIERQQLVESTRRAQLEAETEKLRSSLLSSVSHDLRTPLSVITGATSTLLEEEQLLDAAARRDLLETAYEESERLGRLVRNLLDMTQLSAGVMAPKKEWHPIHDVVGVALNRMERVLRSRVLNIDLPSSLPPVAMDPLLIEQVIVNLLENAAKYTPPGTPVDVRARVTDEGLKVTIGDRGPGVPPEDRERIFEKFCRLNGTGVRGGAGLGLAICRGIIETHGGRIWVESRLGTGANFHFTLPIDDAGAVANDTLPWAS